MSTNRLTTASLALAVMLCVVGCKSSTSDASRAAAMPQRAVVVSGGRQGSPTIYMQSADPRNPTFYGTTANATECPDCKAAAVEYFKTGVLASTCERSGATRTATTVTTPFGGRR